MADVLELERSVVAADTAVEGVGLDVADPSARSVLGVLEALFGPASRWPFVVCLWDGATHPAATPRPPAFTLVLRRPGALRRMLLGGSELALGEAYLRDDFDIEGEVEQAAAVADRLWRRLRSPGVMAALLPRLLALPRDGGPTAADGPAARPHYDVGNDFYALWLDRHMQYTCGYFQEPADDLDAAQTAKLEHICRKLRLRPGDRLLDLGCGWGGLIRYAARHHGVDATGVTLSQPMAAWARQGIAADGLQDRCRVLVTDYRSVAAETPYDKVVSVGFYENLGAANVGRYMRKVWEVLRDGGLFLHHGIITTPRTPAGYRPGLAGLVARRLWGQGGFVQRYVFPGGGLISAAETLELGEGLGFEARDVEAWREHYAPTLRHWVKRLEACHAEAAAMVGEATYRVWRLYMGVSAHGFAVGHLGVSQFLFSKPDGSGQSGLPPTRADLYR